MRKPHSVGSVCLVGTLTFPKCYVEQSVLSGAVGVAWV